MRLGLSGRSLGLAPHEKVQNGYTSVRARLVGLTQPVRKICGILLGLFYSGRRYGRTQEGFVAKI